MTTNTVSPFRNHDHHSKTGAEQTAAWGQVVPSRWPKGLLEQLDALVEKRKLKAGAASEYRTKGEKQSYYEWNAPEDEGIKKALGVSWLRATRNITRSSILHDLVVAETSRKTSTAMKKGGKKKRKASKKKGAKR